MKTKLIQKLFFIPLFSLIAIILSANVSLAYMDYSNPNEIPNYWSYSFTIIHDYDGELEYADDEVMRPLASPYDLSSKVRPRDGYEVSGYDPSSKVTEGTIKDTLTIRYKKKATPPPPPPPNNDNNNPPPQNGGKKDSYIYIYYRSVGGHDVLASQTIQGSDGETLDLNDYVKDVTTMTHVGFNPSSATLTFNKKKRGMGVILYEKNQKLNKQGNSNTIGSQTGKIGNTVINTQNNNVAISSPKLKKGNVRYVKSTNGYVYPNKVLTRAELAGYINEIINESYWDNVEFSVEDFNVVDVVGNTTNVEGIVVSYLTGVMPAKQGNLFKPNAPVTKGDLAIAVANLVDTKKASHTQAEAIKLVTSRKIMSAEKNGNFMPNKTLTRGQVIVILNKLVGNKNVTTKKVQLNDVNAKAWYYKDIQAAVQ